ANLEALRGRGLTLQSTHGDARFDAVQVVEHGAETDPVDALLFCVKPYDNASAAGAVAGAIGPGTVVCSLQNGVDNEAFLRGRLPGAVIVGRGARIRAWPHAPCGVAAR